MSVTGILFVSAFITCLVSAIGKCPLWVSVLLLCVAGMLQVFSR